MLGIISWSQVWHWWCRIRFVACWGTYGWGTGSGRIWWWHGFGCGGNFLRVCQRLMVWWLKCHIVVIFFHGLIQPHFKWWATNMDIVGLSPTCWDFWGIFSYFIWSFAHLQIWLDSARISWIDSLGCFFFSPCRGFEISPLICKIWMGMSNHGGVFWMENLDLQSGSRHSMNSLHILRSIRWPGFNGNLFRRSILKIIKTCHPWFEWFQPMQRHCIEQFTLSHCAEPNY